MKRTILILFMFIMSASLAPLAIAAKEPQGNVSSPSKSQRELREMHEREMQEQESSSWYGIGIISPCMQDADGDGEAIFWCQVEEAIAQKNLAPCTQTSWQNTEVCISEARKKVKLTAKDCQALTDKRFIPFCEELFKEQ